MKKIIILFIIITLVSVAVLLVSCVDNEKNENSSTSKPIENSTVAPDSDHEHYFSVWETVIFPSFESNGLEERECWICQEKETQVVEKLTYAEDLNFELNYANQTYSVANNNEYTGKYVAIPSTYMGLPVVEIEASAFLGNKDIRCVILPDSITEIGKFAFKNCISLAQISFPNSLFAIWEGAFYGAKKLQKIVIPDSVRILDQKAFFDCSSLENVVIGRGITEIKSDSSHKKEGMFRNCTSLKSVTIPDTITSIGKYAFYGCLSLESITIPDSIISIGNGAFGECLNLKEIDLGNGIKHIGDVETSYIRDDGVFQRCLSLSKIDLPDSLESIGAGAFWATGLVEITIPDSVKKIGSDAFKACRALTKVHLPKELTSIGSYAFSHCTSITEITMPKSIKLIGSYAFGSCVALVNVYYEGTLDDWCQIEFSNDGSNPIINGGDLYLNGELVTSVVIPDHISTVPKYVFAGYVRLSSVTIPNTVTCLDEGAFMGCVNLKSIELPESLGVVKGGALGKCTSLEHILINNPKIKIDAYAFDGSTAIQFNEYDNALYLGNERNPYLMLYKVKDKSITSCEINPNTNVIYSSAFSGCNSLLNIYIPDLVNIIGDYAFFGCTSLETISIPNSLEKVGTSAFGFCNSLKYNIYDDVLYLGNEDNPYVLLLEVQDNKKTTYEIPHGTKIIYESAFDILGFLESITIPDSVEVIGNNAFSHCDVLKNVYIPDSVRIIEGYLLFGCDECVNVYIEAKTKPDGWVEHWDEGASINYHWGYTME